MYVVKYVKFDQLKQYNMFATAVCFSKLTRKRLKGSDKSTSPLHVLVLALGDDSMRRVYNYPADARAAVKPVTLK